MVQPDSPRPAATPYDGSVDPAGLGVRAVGSDAWSGELLDVLRLTLDLGEPDVIEPLLRARAARFAPSTLVGLAPLVRIERGLDGRLELWSLRAEGFRLSAVLEWTEARGLATPLDTALTIGDALLAALSSLQHADHGTGASGHGAIAVDQVVIGEDGTLVLTDYVFGAVLPGLQLTRERLWRRYRIAMPPAAGLARFDHRVDVTQAAVVICALLIGRVPRADEYPRDLPRLVAEAVRRSGGDDCRDDRERLTAWLRAATELEPRNAFRSAAAAREALQAAFAGRLNDRAGVRAWLRTARGLDETPAAARDSDVAVNEAASPSVELEADRSHAHTTPVSWFTRLRTWLAAR